MLYLADFFYFISCNQPHVFYINLKYSLFFPPFLPPPRILNLPLLTDAAHMYVLASSPPPSSFSNSTVFYFSQQAVMSLYPTYEHVLKKPNKGENSKQCVLLTRETRDLIYSNPSIYIYLYILLLFVESLTPQDVVPQLMIGGLSSSPP